MDKNSKIIIVGAGFAGITLALSLVQKGYDVNVYDRREDFDEVGFGVQTAPNGIHCIKHLGLYDQVKRVSSQARYRKTTSWDNSCSVISLDLNEDWKSKYGDYWSLNRNDLYQIIKKELLKLNSSCICYDHEFESYENINNLVKVKFKNGNNVTGNILIGADGYNSKVRQFVFNDSPPKKSSMVAWRGIGKISNLNEEDISLDTEIYIGPNTLVISYPVSADQNFYVFTVRTYDHPPEQIEKGTIEEFVEGFKNWLPRLPSVISKIDNFYKWPLYISPPAQQLYQDNVCIIGDSAHAVLPFNGQGMSVALEDAIVLSRCIDYYSDYNRAFSNYERLRKDRAATIANVSHKISENYMNLNEDTDFISEVQKTENRSSLFIWNYNVNEIEILDEEEHLQLKQEEQERAKQEAHKKWLIEEEERQLQEKLEQERQKKIEEEKERLRREQEKKQRSQEQRRLKIEKLKKEKELKELRKESDGFINSVNLYLERERKRISEYQSELQRINSLPSEVKEALADIKLNIPSITKQGLVTGICKIPWKEILINEQGEIFNCGCEGKVDTSLGNILDIDNSIQFDQLFKNNEFKDSILDGSYKFCRASACPVLSNNMFKKEIVEGFTDKIEDIKQVKSKKIYLQIDRSCNLNCLSCRDSIIIHKNNEVTIKTTKILNNLYKVLESFSYDETVEIRLVGNGELFASNTILPWFLNFNFDQFKNVSFYIHTNGTLIYKHSDFLKSISNRITGFEVSIDAAYKETYEKVRLNGKWDDLLKGFELLKDLKDLNPNIETSASFTIYDSNYQDLPYFTNFASSDIFNFIVFYQIQRWGHLTNSKWSIMDIFNKNSGNYLDLIKHIDMIDFNDTRILPSTIDYLRNNK